MIILSDHLNFFILSFHSSSFNIFELRIRIKDFNFMKLASKSSSLRLATKNRKKNHRLLNCYLLFGSSNHQDLSSYLLRLNQRNNLKL
jgi:hypothetical protein